MIDFRPKKSTTINRTQKLIFRLTLLIALGIILTLTILSYI